MLINQKDYDVSELFINSAKSRRLLSGSLSNVLSVSGSPASHASAASPTNPYVPPSVSTATASSTSIPVGINKVGNVISAAVSGGNLSSEGLLGSQKSVNNSSEQQLEMQQGLYLTLRSSFRDSRISTEKEYMEVCLTLQTDRSKCNNFLNFINQ